MSQVNDKPDVLVLGAGVYGLSTAWYLAQKGLKVTVIDRSAPGTEASGMALGRLDPLLKGIGSSSKSPGGGIGRPPNQKELADLSFAEHKALDQEIITESGVDFQIDHQPTLQLFYQHSDLDSFKKNITAFNSDGFHSEILSLGEIRGLDERIRPTKHGGALINGPYFINSMLFTRALAICAKNKGVKIETAEAFRIETGLSTTVHTNQGHYSSSTIVLAMGPWTGEIFGKFGLQKLIKPSKGEIIKFNPPISGPLSVHLHAHCSVVMKRDGMVWVAATAAESDFDRTPTKNARNELIEKASLMMPESVNQNPIEQTVCFRPSTPDDLPIVGQVDINDNIYAVSGGGGWGIMTCLYIGKQASKMIIEKTNEPDLKSISLHRF